MDGDGDQAAEHDNDISMASNCSGEVAATEHSKRLVNKHFANVFKSFIGSNYLSVPFAFSAAGFIWGPIAIGFIAGISAYGCLLLVKIRKILQAQHRPSDTYGQVAGSILGPWADAFVEFFLALTQVGWCIGYTIYINTAIHQFSGDSSSLGSATIIYLILTPAFFLLCCVPDLKHFIPFSTASNLALFIAFLSILSLALHKIQTDGVFHTTYSISPVKLALSFGNLVSSFEGIGTVLSVEGSMAKDHIRGHYPRLLNLTLFSISILFSLFGIIGYGGFGGNDLCSVILTNLPPGLVSHVTRVALIIGLFFTYGFQMFPVLELADLRLLENRRRRGRWNSREEGGLGDSPSSNNINSRDDGPLLFGGPKRSSSSSSSLPPPPATTAAATVTTKPRVDNERGGANHFVRNGSIDVHDGYGALESPPRERKVHHGDDDDDDDDEDRVGEEVEDISLFTMMLQGFQSWSLGDVIRYLGIRISVVLFASSIAYFIPEFELIIALIGSLGASTLAFIIPGILALSSLPSTLLHRSSYVFLIVFGLVGGAIGTYYAIRDIINGTSRC